MRTYVHSGGKDPGVWFFSLDAANAIAVEIARSTFGLPYFHARMGLEIDPIEGRPGLTYRSKRRARGPNPARSEIRAKVIGPVVPAAPGSLEHFLAERYFLDSTHLGKLFRGQVHHRPYPLQAARVDSLDETLIAAAGLIRPDLTPIAHYAAGVNVNVFGLTRL